MIEELANSCGIALLSAGGWQRSGPSAGRLSGVQPGVIPAEQLQWLDQDVPTIGSRPKRLASDELSKTP